MIRVICLLYFFFCYSKTEYIFHKATETWLSVLRRRAHPQNIHSFGWFINTSVHQFNLFQIFSSSNFKHQKIVSLPKMRMFPTSVFCQCVKLNLHWSNWDSASSCFFKQLNIATSSLHQRRKFRLPWVYQQTWKHFICWLGIASFCRRVM